MKNFVMPEKNMNKKIFAIIILLFLLLSVILAAIPQAAGALGMVTITVKNPDPIKGNYSWFVYEKEAGETIHDTATIKNVGKEPTEVQIYAVDASTNEAGSFTLSQMHEEQQNLGTWTEINHGPFTLNPQQSIDIPFKIQIPTNITPGQYTGGIIVENGTIQNTNENIQQETDQNTRGSVSVKTRIGTRIYLTIPGNIHEDIKLISATAAKELNGKTRFILAIENNGNLTYEPKAIVNIYDTFGLLYEQIEQTLGTSSPGTIIKPNVKMTKQPLIGSFTANIDIIYESQFRPEGMHQSALTDTINISFWVMPWRIVLPTLLLLIIIGAAFYKKRVNRLNYLLTSQEYIVQENDDLIALGIKTKTPWKTIAKYNNLKPPYIIKAGDQLKIPKK
jgi:hypothetical protein